MQRTRMTLALAAVLTLGMTTAPAWSADNDGDKKAKRAERAKKGEGEQGKKRGPGAHSKRGAHLHKALQGLDLSDQQKADIKKIMEEVRGKARARFEENKEAFAKLREEAEAARKAQDKEKLKELAKKRQELMGGGANPQQVREKIMAVLTEEQRQKLHAKFKEARAKRGEGKPAGKKPGGDGDKPRKRPDKKKDQG